MKKEVWWLDAGSIDVKLWFDSILEDGYLLLLLLFNLQCTCMYIFVVERLYIKYVLLIESIMLLK